MKYGILNEFGERVQNSVRNSELPPIISRECGFSFISLFKNILRRFETFLMSYSSFLPQITKNPKYRPNFFKFRRKHTKFGI